jgi:hypothetical protein
MTCPRVPKITWSGSFGTQLDIAYPLNNLVASSRAFDGSTFLQIESGEEDAWIINTEYYLEGDVRFIPNSNTTASGTMTQTGWDGDAGVRAFIEWAQEKNIFRFYPDKTSGTYIESYLVEPTTTAPNIESDGTRTIRLVIRNASTPYDGY